MNPTPPSVSLEGEVVVVTGAAGAIGSRLARDLAAAGASPVLVDRAPTAPLAAELAAQGHDALPLEVDLEDPARATEALSGAVGWKGRVDALVNMAGLYYAVPRVPFWEIDPETWDRVVTSNLRTAFVASRALAPAMIAERRGRIVNVGSNVAVFGMANFAHYLAAKAGIVGLTRGMSRELGPYGVAVNCVAPGLVRTERGVEELGADYFDQVAAGQCLRTPLLPEDVAAAVLWLLSPGSRMVTGQTLLVNGGATMGPA